jgi:hypothetical protein
MPHSVSGWLLLGFSLPVPATAQIRASEPASVSQTVDGTRLTVTFSRPRARARDSLFGKVVTWNEVWTPGANLATTLETSKNIRLNGRAVPQGKYSVWMVVRPSGEWTAVLDPRAALFHEAHPDSTAQQIRFPVHTAQRPFVEVLTWWFPEIRGSGVTLGMQWGTTYVPLEVEVEPSYTLSFPAEASAPYVGEYEYRWKMPGDAWKPVVFTVVYEKGSLLGRWTPSPYPEWGRFVLIRIKDDWFIPGFLDEKGNLYEVAKELVFEFKLETGRATSLEVRGEDDSVIATAKRKG